MILETILVALLSVENLSNFELEKYYWDCDTTYMKQELNGQDFNSCLSITEMFIFKIFNNDKDLFMQYWYKNHNTEWNKRGYIDKTV